MVHARTPDARANERTPRARILSILREQGPQTLASLAVALGLDRSSVEYHVRRLERERELHTTRLHGRRYALLATQRPAPPTLAGAILAILRDRGGRLTNEEIAAAAPSAGPRAIRRVLRELARRGLVAAEPPAFRLLDPEGTRQR